MTLIDRSRGSRPLDTSWEMKALSPGGVMNRVSQDTLAYVPSTETQEKSSLRAESLSGVPPQNRLGERAGWDFQPRIPLAGAGKRGDQVDPSTSIQDAQVQLMGASQEFNTTTGTALLAQTAKAQEKREERI